MAPNAVHSCCHLLACLCSAQTALSTLCQESCCSSCLIYFQSGKHKGKSKPSLQLGQKVSGGLWLARLSQLSNLEPINIAKVVRCSDWLGLSHMPSPGVGKPNWINHMQWILPQDGEKKKKKDFQKWIGELVINNQKIPEAHYSLYLKVAQNLVPLLSSAFHELWGTTDTFFCDLQWY